MGVTDIKGFPRNHPANMPYWPALIESPSSPEGTTMHWMTEVMLTPIIKWSWTVNADIPAGGGTLTDTRTVSGMWRTNYNTEWGDVSMATVGYELDTTENRWSDGFWLKKSMDINILVVSSI